MINDMKLIFFRNMYYKYIKANRYPFVKKYKLDKTIQKIKDIHKGKECFIIGNGPSLRVQDLDNIKKYGIISFAANGIYNLFDQTEWRPDFYVCQDQQMIDGIKGKLDYISKECKKIIIRRDNYSNVKHTTKITDDFIFPKLVMKIRKDKNYNFSDDLKKCAYDGCTVTYFMLQIAFYMGFRTIYLLGIDHNFPVAFDENDNIVVNNSTRMHAFEDEKHVIINPARVLETTYAYESAKRYLETNGVTVYNATRGGKLEVFERKDIDAFFCDMEGLIK